LGWIMAFGGGRFAEAFNLMGESVALKQRICVSGVRMPRTCRAVVTALLNSVPGFSKRVRSTHSTDLMVTFKEKDLKSMANFCPGAKI
jgi:hypothetical protein